MAAVAAHAKSQRQHAVEEEEREARRQRVQGAPAFPLPRPPGRIAQLLQKYQARGAHPAGRAAGGHAAAAGRRSGSAVPPLGKLALDAVAANYAQYPDIDHLDPKFVLAITSSLPLDLDLTVTAPYVHDENYWRRKCTEWKQWPNCRPQEHGMSWKQLFLERAATESLEEFGVERGITKEYEDAFLRPPIDSRHGLWREVYPRAPTTLPDGTPRPNRERFCKYGMNCEAVRIARAANSGWPGLERLKPLVVPAVQKLDACYAWADLDEEVAWPFYTARVKREEEEAAAAAAAAEAGEDAPAPRRKPDAAAAAGGAGAELRAAAAAGGEALARYAQLRMGSASGVDDGDEPPVDDGVWVGAAEDGMDAEAEPERQCDANVLREFLLPEQMERFRLTGKWPKARQPCLVCHRAEQLAALCSQLEASEDHVFALKLEQMPAHLDMEIPFSRLPNLASLSLSYSVTRPGVVYDPSLLGMKLTDAMSLAKVCKATPCLASLSLPSSGINDELLQMMMTGLIHNQTITELDLSHNRISSHGARLLAKLLTPPCVLMSLDLADNQVHEEGGKFLGKALRKNDSLVELDLSLNRLSDGGGHMLATGLLKNSTLTSLGLGSNGLSSSCVGTLARHLSQSWCPLAALDLTGNRLEAGDATSLQQALQANVTLTSLDLRGNRKVPAASPAVDELQQITRRNELNLRALMSAV